MALVFMRGCSDSRLIDFFRFFSHDFQFNNSVLSLRAGQLTKESKGWVNDVRDLVESLGDPHSHPDRRRRTQ